MFGEKVTKRVRAVIFFVGCIFISVLYCSGKEPVLTRDKNTVFIPAGEFTMGTNTGEEEEKPSHSVYLDNYWIGKYEVTVGEYRLFIKDTKQEPPKIWDDEDISPTKNHPVVGVAWIYAKEYTKWLKKKTNIPYTLPTEAQWEKAARGTDGRIYPWGNNAPTVKEARANFVIDEDGYRFTAPGGKFLKGISPYGIFDMAGNVWEWCLDWYDSAYYKKKISKNPMGPEKGKVHVVRGGSWRDHPYLIRTTTRNANSSSTYKYGLIGFRIAVND